MLDWRTWIHTYEHVKQFIKKLIIRWRGPKNIESCIYKIHRKGVQLSKEHFTMLLRIRIAQMNYCLNQSLYWLITWLDAVLDGKTVYARASVQKWAFSTTRDASHPRWKTLPSLPWRVIYYFVNKLVIITRNTLNTLNHSRETWEYRSGRISKSAVNICYFIFYS